MMENRRSICSNSYETSRRKAYRRPDGEKHYPSPEGEGFTDPLSGTLKPPKSSKIVHFVDRIWSPFGDNSAKSLAEFNH